MNLNIRQLKDRGAALAGASRQSTRSLVLLYCGVLAVLSLGSSGLSLYLDSRISGTGGLDGLGLRSLLQTIQEILTYINLTFGPFWSAGFLFAMISLVRGYEPEKQHLAEGFRRFGRILGHMAFRFLTMVVMGMASVHMGGIIFSMSPVGKEFAEAMAPVMADPNLINADGTLNMNLVSMDLIWKAGIPMCLMILAVFGLIWLFISYQFRLSMYLVMDRPIGAVAAHFLSLRLMKGHKWQMFKMDLSYWWYYLLMLAVGVVGYLDVVLSLLGIPVPIDPMVMFFGTLAVYCVLFTALCLWKKCQVDASYVLAYEAIANPVPVETAE